MNHQHGEHILQEKYGTTKQAAAFYNNQMIDHLNEVMRIYISKQDMMFISTADSKGNCDSSFRSGTPGFVRIIDEYKLIYPEYKGNGVMASLGNMSENPHIGLLFIDFFEDHIGLHVNGTAEILENGELNTKEISNRILKELEENEEFKVQRWVMVEVEEAYIHCSKHIPKLKRLEKEFRWGTDDEKQKGGDYFKTKDSKRSY